MRPVRLSTAPAFTLVELLVLILCIIFLLMAIVPTADRSATKVRTAACLNNLKQVGMGLYLFASDHGDQFPWKIPIDQRGSMASPVIDSPLPHCQALSNQLPTLKVWVCPTDPRKQPAPHYGVFDARNVSYFLSLDAALTNARPQSFILAGDRHLEVAGKPLEPGSFILTTNQPVAWTLELHGDNQHSPGGAMLFLDGHAEFLRTHRVMPIVQAQGLATNFLVVP